MFKDLRGYVKKGFRQAKNAVGGIIHSDDTTEFDERVVRWEGQIEGLKKLKDSLEIFIEALSTVGAAGAVLGESLNQHFVNQIKETKESNPVLSQFVGISLLFEKINADLNNNIQTAFRATITNRCLKPLNSVLSKTSDMSKKLDARKTLIIDRDVYKTKCEKDAATKNAKEAEIVRHKQKFQTCSEELEKIESEVVDAFDQFDDAMPDLFGNEIAAMVASMYYYSSSSAVLLGQLLPFLPQSQSTLCLLSMSTATSKFLQSPAVRQDLEGGSSGGAAAIVHPTYERSEIYGGSIGEYGVKVPVVSDDPPLHTQPYPAPHVPAQHISYLSHAGSTSSTTSAQISEEFISPLHANLGTTANNTTIKYLPGYKNTGKTLTSDTENSNANATGSNNGSNVNASVHANVTTNNINNSTTSYMSTTAISGGPLPLNTVNNNVSVHTVHVESAVTTARDENQPSGGPAQTITSQEQVDNLFANQPSLTSSPTRHTVPTTTTTTYTANASHNNSSSHINTTTTTTTTTTGTHHSTIHLPPPPSVSPTPNHHNHHPVINFPPPPSSSHMNSARSVQTTMTTDSIPIAQPQVQTQVHSASSTGADTSTSGLVQPQRTSTGDFGVPPSPVLKPSKPVKTSVKSSASLSQSPSDVKFDDSDI